MPRKKSTLAQEEGKRYQVSVTLTEYDFKKILKISKEEERAKAKVAARLMRSGLKFEALMENGGTRPKLLELLHELDNPPKKNGNGNGNGNGNSNK